MAAYTPSRRTLLIIALSFAAFSAAFMQTEAMFPTRRAPGGQFVNRPRPGTEVLAVFLASSTCGALEYPGLVEAMDRIRRTLRAAASREGKTFVAVGVSLDQDPWHGAEFLKKLGQFDEILSGGSWLNTGSIAFILRDFPGRRSIPQLVLVERDVTMSGNNGVESVNDRFVTRKIGAEAIVNFAASLSDLPPRASAGDQSGVEALAPYANRP